MKKTLRVSLSVVAIAAALSAFAKLSVSLRPSPITRSEFAESIRGESPAAVLARYGRPDEAKSIFPGDETFVYRGRIRGDRQAIVTFTNHSPATIRFEDGGGTMSEIRFTP